MNARMQTHTRERSDRSARQDTHTRELAADSHAPAVLNTYSFTKGGVRSSTTMSSIHRCWQAMKEPGNAGEHPTDMFVNTNDSAAPSIQSGVRST